MINNNISERITYADVATKDDGSNGASEKMLAETQSSTKENKDQCKPSPEYKEIIDLLIDSYYDPSAIKEQDKLRSKYDCQIKNQDDAITYADKAIEELNLPYTDLYTKTELDVMTSDIAGKYYGVGMSLTNIDRPGSKSRTRVDELAPGGAAETAGLQRGDQILRIDGQDVSTFNHKEVSSLIRSDKAAPLSITVYRDGEEKTFENVQRRLIESSAVKDPTMTDGIVHVTVTTFAQEDTSDELKAALEKFPDAKAFIIDLRHNNGGLVQEALRSLSLFMGSGKLMTEQQRISARDGGSEGEATYVNKDFNLTPDKIAVRKYFPDFPGIEGIAPSVPRHKDIVDKPVVILTDEMTASASEIFSAAMKDHKEATLIGTKTLGKGIGQDLYQGLPGGAGMAITTMRIYSPNKHWVGDGAEERYGIEPDIEVQKTENAVEVARNFLKTKMQTK
ncbi:MAG: PDZ domain-containing protein [Candidatus Obscuribacterales bacterium]|jgi:carboxyl-terminal processing protease|nr:PDZ domain-containing protein [Candidatus Obscuribacterales bacterium]